MRMESMPLRTAASFCAASLLRRAFVRFFWLAYCSLNLRFCSRLASMSLLRNSSSSPNVVLSIRSQTLNSTLASAPTSRTISVSIERSKTSSCCSPCAQDTRQSATMGMTAILFMDVVFAQTRVTRGCANEIEQSRRLGSFL